MCRGTMVTFGGLCIAGPASKGPFICQGFKFAAKLFLGNSWRFFFGIHALTTLNDRARVFAP